MIALSGFFYPSFNIHLFFLTNVLMPTQIEIIIEITARNLKTVLKINL